jgi:hypothetical protein
MSTNQEKSFITTMNTRFGHPHFSRLTYDKTLTTARPDYEAFAFSHHIDVSNCLCLKSNIAQAR